MYAYEHPYIEERLTALGQVVDRQERARLLREIADHKFNEFCRYAAVLAVRRSRSEPEGHCGLYFPREHYRVFHASRVH